MDDNKKPYDFEDEDEDPIAESVKSPAVLDEEDPFSGDATDSVAVDIDEELAKVGLKGDDGNEDIEPLGVDEDID